MVFPGDRDRADEVATFLEGALQDGEGFLVRCNNFAVEVVPFHEQEPFELKHTHEELYGCLLSINEEISERQFPYFWLTSVALVFFCLALHLQWLDTLLNIDFEGIRSIWFYLSTALATVVLYNIIIGFVERSIYRRRRPELLQAIFEAGINRYKLLARMEGDPGISHISDKLKIDQSSGHLPQ